MSSSKISVGDGYGSILQYLGFNNEEQTTKTKQPQTKETRTETVVEDYTVKPGDTLSKLAEKRGTSLNQILRNNPQIKNPDKISVGQHIKLADKGGTTATAKYTIKRGDTLQEIAKRHHTTVGDILRANSGRISNANLIFPGQQIRIPVKANAPKQQPIPSNHPTTNAPSKKQPTQTQATNATGTNDVTSTGQTTAANGSQAARINLDDFLSPEKGSNAGFAVLIGAAEGNRYPNGDYTDHYRGHKDPGDGLWNIGSFSRANARFPNARPAGSPQEADKMHLQHMQGAKAKYVETMTKAGLDPNNALLASTYFDAFNQSERAASKMLAPENMAYLKEKGVSVETMKDWRVGGYVNLQTGQRWLNSTGKLVGGGLAKIANREAQRKYGRPATEQEVQQLIRRDQGRRMDQIVKTLKDMNLLSTNKPILAPQIPQPQTPTIVTTAPVPNKPVNGTGLPDTSGMSETQKYDVYSKYFEAKGVNLDTKPDQRSILGLRVPTNSKANNNHGAYDDRFVVMWTDQSGQKHVKEFKGNTEPNYRYVAQGRGKDVNGDGNIELASIKEGAYQFGKSRVSGGALAGQRALREEDNTIRSIYDTSGDGLHNKRDREANASGILFHKGGANDVQSMGCQTLPPDQFNQFWDALGDDSKFTYLLVDTSK